MSKELSSTRVKRLDVQGFDSVPLSDLAPVAPWLGMAYTLCATLAIIGTVMASVPLLLALAGIAGLAALFPVHPFDLIYNHGIRHIRGTGPLPRRAAQGRFACAIATAFLLTEVWAFTAGWMVTGYVLGGALAAVGLLVGLTDICIPSMVYRVLFGPRHPQRVDGAGAS